MAVYMAAVLLLDDEEDDERNNRNNIMRVTRKLLRDAFDPFSISNHEFRKLYR